MELETLNSIMPFPSVGDTDMHAMMLIPVCLSRRRIEWWNKSKVWKVWIRYSLYSSDNYLNSEKKSMKWLPNFWLLDYTRKLLLMNEICVSILVLKILIHLVLGGDWDSIWKLFHQVFLMCFQKELLSKLFNKPWKLWYDYIFQGKSTRFCFIFLIIWINVSASRSTMYQSACPKCVETVPTVRKEWLGVKIIMDWELAAHWLIYLCEECSSDGGFTSIKQRHSCVYFWVKSLLERVNRLLLGRLKLFAKIEIPLKR